MGGEDLRVTGSSAGAGFSAGAVQAARSKMPVSPSTTTVPGGEGTTAESVPYFSLQQNLYNTIVPSQVRQAVGTLYPGQPVPPLITHALEDIYSNTLYYDVSGLPVAVAALKPSGSAKAMYIRYNPDEPQWQALKLLFGRTLATKDVEANLKLRISAQNLGEVVRKYADLFKRELTTVRDQLRPNTPAALENAEAYVELANLLGVVLPAGGFVNGNEQQVADFITNLITAIDTKLQQDGVAAIAILLASKISPKDVEVITQYLRLIEKGRLVFMAGRFDIPQKVTRETITVEVNAGSSVMVSGYKYEPTADRAPGGALTYKDDPFLSAFGAWLLKEGLIRENTPEEVFAFVRHCRKGGEKADGLLNAEMLSFLAGTSAEPAAGFVSSDVKVELKVPLNVCFTRDPETGAFSFSVYRETTLLYEARDGVVTMAPADPDLRGIQTLLDRANFGGMSWFAGVYSFYNQYSNRIFGTEGTVEEYDVNFAQSAQFSAYLQDTMLTGSKQREQDTIDFAGRIHAEIKRRNLSEEDRELLLKIATVLLGFIGRGGIEKIDISPERLVAIANSILVTFSDPEAIEAGYSREIIDIYFKYYDKQSPQYQSPAYLKDVQSLEGALLAIFSDQRFGLVAGTQFYAGDLLNATGIAYAGRYDRLTPLSSGEIDGELTAMRGMLELQDQMEARYGKNMQTLVVDQNVATVLAEVAAESSQRVRSDMPLGMVIKLSPLVLTANLINNEIADPLVFAYAYLAALDDLQLLDIDDALLTRLQLFVEGKYQPDRDEIQFLIDVLYDEDSINAIALDRALTIIREAGQQRAIAPAWQRFLNGEEGIKVMVDRAGRFGALPYEPVSPTRVDATATVGKYVTAEYDYEDLKAENPIANYTLLLARVYPQGLTAEQYYLVSQWGMPLTSLTLPNVVAVKQLFGGHYYMELPLSYEGYTALDKILQGEVSFPIDLQGRRPETPDEDYHLTEAEFAVLRRVIDFRRNQDDWEKAVLDREEKENLISAQRKLAVAQEILQEKAAKDKDAEIAKKDTEAAQAFGEAARELQKVIDEISTMSSAMSDDDYGRVNEFIGCLGRGEFVGADGVPVVALTSLNPADYGVADPGFEAGLTVVERLLTKGLGGATFVEERLPTTFGGKVRHGMAKGMKESSAPQSLENIFGVMPDGYVQFLKLMFFGGTAEAVEACKRDIEAAKQQKEEYEALVRALESDPTRRVFNQEEFDQAKAIYERAKKTRALLVTLLAQYENDPQNKALVMLLLGAIVSTYDIELDFMEKYKEMGIETYLVQALGTAATEEQRQAFMMVVINDLGEGQMNYEPLKEMLGEAAFAVAIQARDWFRKTKETISDDRMKALNIAKDEYTRKRAAIYRYLNNTEIDADLWNCMSTQLKGMFEMNFDWTTELSAMGMPVKDEHGGDIDSGEEAIAFIGRVFAQSGSRWFDASPAISDPPDVRAAKLALILAVSTLPFEQSTVNLDAALNVTATVVERSQQAMKLLESIPYIRRVPLFALAGVAEWAIFGRFLNIEIGADNLEDFKQIVNSRWRREAQELAQLGSGLSRPMSFSSYNVANIANMLFNPEPISPTSLAGDVFVNYRTIDYKVVDTAIREIKRLRSEVVSGGQQITEEDEDGNSITTTAPERAARGFDEGVVLIDYLDEEKFTQTIASLEALRDYMRDEKVKIALTDPYHASDFYDQLEDTLPEGATLAEPSSLVRLGARRLSQFTLDYSILETRVIYPEQPAMAVDEVLSHDPSRVLKGFPALTEGEPSSSDSSGISRRVKVEGDTVTIIRQDVSGVPLLLTFDRESLVHRKSKDAYELMREGARGVGGTALDAVYDPEAIGCSKDMMSTSTACSKRAAVQAAVLDTVLQWHKEAALEGANFGYLIPVHILTGFVNDLIEGLTAVEQLAAAAHDDWFRGDEVAAQIHLEQAKQMWDSMWSNLSHTYGSFLAFEMNPMVILSNFFYDVFEAKDAGRAIGDGFVTIPIALEICAKWLRLGKVGWDAALGRRVGRVRFTSYGLAASFVTAVPHNILALTQESADFLRAEKAADRILEWAKAEIPAAELRAGTTPADLTLADLTAEQIRRVYMNHWQEIMREFNFNIGLDFTVTGTAENPTVTMDDRVRTRLAEEVVQRDPLGRPLEDPFKLPANEVAARICQRNYIIIAGAVNHIVIEQDRANYNRAVRAMEIVLQHAAEVFPAKAQGSDGEPRPITISDLTDAEVTQIYDRYQTDIVRDCFSDLAVAQGDAAAQAAARSQSARRITFRHLARLRANPAEIGRSGFYRWVDATLFRVGRGTAWVGRNTAGRAERGYQDIVGARANPAWTDSGYRVTGAMGEGAARARDTARYSQKWRWRLWRGLRMYQKFGTVQPGQFLALWRDSSLVGSVADGIEQTKQDFRRVFSEALVEQGYGLEEIDAAMPYLEQLYMLDALTVESLMPEIGRYIESETSRMILEEAQRLHGQEKLSFSSVEELRAAEPELYKRAEKSCKKSIKAFRDGAVGAYFRIRVSMYGEWAQDVVARVFTGPTSGVPLVDQAREMARAFKEARDKASGKGGAGDANAPDGADDIVLDDPDEDRSSIKKEDPEEKTAEIPDADQAAARALIEEAFRSRGVSVQLPINFAGEVDSTAFTRLAELCRANRIGHIEFGEGIGMEHLRTIEAAIARYGGQLVSLPGSAATGEGSLSLMVRFMVDGSGGVSARPVVLVQAGGGFRIAQPVVGADGRVSLQVGSEVFSLEDIAARTYGFGMNGATSADPEATPPEGYEPDRTDPDVDRTNPRPDTDPGGRPDADQAASRSASDPRAADSTNGSRSGSTGSGLPVRVGDMNGPSNPGAGRQESQDPVAPEPVVPEATVHTPTSRSPLIDVTAARNTIITEGGVEIVGELGADFFDGVTDMATVKRFAQGLRAGHVTQLVVVGDRVRLVNYPVTSLHGVQRLPGEAGSVLVLQPGGISPQGGQEVLSRLNSYCIMEGRLHPLYLDEISYQPTYRADIYASNPTEFAQMASGQMRWRTYNPSSPSNPGASQQSSQGPVVPPVVGATPPPRSPLIDVAAARDTIMREGGVAIAGELGADFFDGVSDMRTVREFAQNLRAGRITQLVVRGGVRLMDCSLMGLVGSEALPGESGRILIIEPSGLPPQSGMARVVIRPLAYHLIQGRFHPLYVGESRGMHKAGRIEVTCLTEYYAASVEEFAQMASGQMAWRAAPKRGGPKPPSSLPSGYDATPEASQKLRQARLHDFQDRLINEYGEIPANALMQHIEKLPLAEICALWDDGSLFDLQGRNNPATGRPVTHAVLDMPPEYLAQKLKISVDAATTLQVAIRAYIHTVASLNIVERYKAAMKALKIEGADRVLTLDDVMARQKAAIERMGKYITPEHFMDLFRHPEMRIFLQSPEGRAFIEELGRAGLYDSIDASGALLVGLMGFWGAAKVCEMLGIEDPEIALAIEFTSGFVSSEFVAKNVPITRTTQGAALSFGRLLGIRSAQEVMLEKFGVDSVAALLRQSGRSMVEAGIKWVKSGSILADAGKFGVNMAGFILAVDVVNNILESCGVSPDNFVRKHTVGILITGQLGAGAAATGANWLVLRFGLQSSSLGSTLSWLGKVKNFFAPKAIASRLLTAIMRVKLVLLGGEQIYKLFQDGYQRTVNARVADQVMQDTAGDPGDERWLAFPVFVLRYWLKFLAGTIWEGAAANENPEACKKIIAADRSYSLSAQTYLAFLFEAIKSDLPQDQLVEKYGAGIARTVMGLRGRSGGAEWALSVLEENIDLEEEYEGVKRRASGDEDFAGLAERAQALLEDNPEMTAVQIGQALWQEFEFEYPEQVHEFVQDLFATSVQSSLAMLYGMYSEDEDYPLLVNAPIREFCDEKGRVVDREAMLSWIPQGLVVGQYAALSEEYRKADEAARISYKAKMKLFNGDEDALAAAVEADPAKYKGFLDKQERALQLQVQLALVTARLRVAYVDEGQPAWLTEVLRKNGFHFVQPLYGPAAAAFYAEVAFYGETDTLKWVDDARYIERLRALLVDYDTAEQAMQTDLAELPAGADLSDPTTIPAGMALKLSVDALILQGQQLNVLMELERFERLPERHNITVHPGGVNYDDFEPEGPDD